MVHEKEMQKGNRDRATLAVARKLVAYLARCRSATTKFRACRRTTDQAA
jgi:hypothetical protein